MKSEWNGPAYIIAGELKVAIMSLSPGHAQPSSRPIHRTLWVAAMILVIGAGLILWAVRGEAVFFDLAASLYAMCF